MAINCQDVSARMMELLYGELSGDDRATVEAHLAGCASCAAELATFQSTRAAARRALDVDEPPARAHQAILRASAAAVAAKQAKPIEARAAARRPSFWERWRTRWTLPTFATLGAVAVVVLASKVFLEPDKTVELGRRAVQSAPAEAPAAPPGGAEPQATARQATEKEDEQRGATGPGRKEAQGPAAGRAAALGRERAGPVDRSADDGAASASGARGFRCARRSGEGGRSRQLRTSQAPASDGISLEDDIVAAPPAALKPSKRAFAPPPPPLAGPRARRSRPRTR